MEDEKLIECVKYYQHLYDLNHPKYMDNIKKDIAWKEISQQIRAPAAVCKQRWQSLRDAYRRALNKRKSKTSPATKTKKWKYEDEMAFLAPYFACRKKDTEESEDADDEDNVEMQQDSWVTEPGHSITNETETEPEYGTPQRTQDPTTVLITRLLEERKQKQEKQDALDSFFLSISATCKKFSPYIQAVLKRKIFNLVSEVEIQQLTHASAVPKIVSSLESQGIKHEMVDETPIFASDELPIE